MQTVFASVRSGSCQRFEQVSGLAHAKGLSNCEVWSCCACSPTVVLLLVLSGTSHGSTCAVCRQGWLPALR